jgi:hypothetical protein
VRHFEGTTSLSAHATRTNDHLQRVLRNTQLSYQDPELAAALTSLSQIVSGKNTYPGEVGPPAYDVGVLNKKRYDIPPADLVSQVLRDVESIYDDAVGLLYPLRAYKDVVALCKDLYFNIEDVPIPRLIVTFGSLYYIFEFYQYSLEADDPRQEQYTQHTTSFARNMMDLLSHLNLLMAPSEDNVEALMLIVSCKEQNQMSATNQLTSFVYRLITVSRHQGPHCAVNLSSKQPTSVLLWDIIAPTL